MKYQCFHVSIKDHIALITLNRPEKRNSMIAEFWDELPTIIQIIDAQAKARVIVIASTGPHFSAGLDLGVFGTSAPPEGKNAQQTAFYQRQKGARFYDSVRHMQKAFTSLEQCRIPVLAAIQGGAIGAGVDLITACDMRYMTEDAYLSIYEINIGMTADVGTFPRLVKLIPEGIVKELAYTGRNMNAQEAKAVGLVNAVFADQDTMLAEVMKIAAQISTKAPLAIYGSKQIINYSRDHNTADGLDYIRIWNASMLQADEIQEAFKAKAEQRTAEFVDLPPIRGRMTNEIVD
ncbi:MAG: enoyl-CoA hydratase [SAR86 cluster bacterium]|uniref:Enoyl-CoA hydratase n=1 Tax=SAR86 cluster bacterium TaxID=2030880 RepID=A0A2A4MLT1_9GAMM|nr:MAG: enoyl-CoA hydratase [SAR86 cluster bacterium]